MNHGVSMNPRRGVLETCLALLAISTPAVAQDLSEVCPGAQAGTGALLGRLSDADAQVALPGAMVFARWTVDGASERVEAQTSSDGGFTLCEVPLETEVLVAGMIGSSPGPTRPVILTEPVTRLDIEISLAAATGSGEKMLACLGTPDSRLRYQVGGLVHCDPRWPGLESCPREDLGRVSVPSPDTPSSSDPFPGLESLIAQARALGANALVDIQQSTHVGRRPAGSTGGGLLTARAVVIDVDPATC